MGGSQRTQVRRWFARVSKEGFFQRSAPNAKCLDAEAYVRNTQSGLGNLRLQKCGRTQLRAGRQSLGVSLCTSTGSAAALGKDKGLRCSIVRSQLCRNCHGARSRNQAKPIPSATIVCACHTKPQPHQKPCGETPYRFDARFPVKPHTVDPLVGGPCRCRRVHLGPDEGLLHACP